MKRLVILLMLALVAGCDRPSAGPASDGSRATTSGAPASPAQPTSPTPPALPEDPPPTRGAPSETCVDGWVTPASGSGLATFPLRMIHRTVRVPGDPVVVEMRYFTGPESPPSDKGYILTVERWYVKLFVEEDLTFQGRFLVESREFGDGVVAVAPYDTSGFRAPDWSAFQWEEADPKARAYPALPGRWAGTRYDFVRGGEGLTIPGLPEAVRGCMDST